MSEDDEGRFLEVEMIRAKMIAVESLAICDERERIHISLDRSDGEAAIQVYDDEGRVRGSFCLADGHPMIMLASPDREVGVRIRTTDTESFLRLHSASETTRVGLFASEDKAEVDVFDKEGQAQLLGPAPAPAGLLQRAVPLWAFLLGLAAVALLARL